MDFFDLSQSIKTQDIKKPKQWGTRAWFERQAKGDVSSPASYFSHHLNGYQRFRHNSLALFINKNLSTNHLNFILDVGCACGDFLYMLKKTLTSRYAIGFDFIEKIIHQGHHRYPDLNLAVASLPEIPVHKAVIDLVIASEVLYYLPKKDQVQTIQKIHDILAPGGYLFFTSAMGSRYFTLSSARDLISPYFDIVNVNYLHSKLYHKLISFVYSIVRFNDLLYTMEEPGDQKNNQIFKKLKLIFNNKIGKCFLRLITPLFEKILYSVRLPAACEAIGKRFSSCFKSNVIILAQRRDDVSC
jgi:ubiquinone/menaquinone biosynthesis C-methylase UbiE